MVDLIYSKANYVSNVSEFYLIEEVVYRHIFWCLDTVLTETKLVCFLKHMGVHDYNLMFPVMLIEEVYNIQQI